MEIAKTLVCRLFSVSRATLVVVWLIFLSCKTVSTITVEPIQRTELSAYVEQMVREYKDSCRITQIIGGVKGEEDTYYVKCKHGANKAKELLK